MSKIITIKEAIMLSSKLRKQNKSIVLAGGVFDILHIGHVKFFENAKKEGDLLFVLLESDKSVSKLKGPRRPINKQKDRAEVLSALSVVDFIILLRGILKNKDYDRIVKQISPDVLAITNSDPNIIHKVRQSKLTGAKIKIVLRRLKNKSTSRILTDYE